MFSMQLTLRYPPPRDKLKFITRKPDILSCPSVYALDPTFFGGPLMSFHLINYKSYDFLIKCAVPAATGNGRPFTSTAL